MSEGTGKGKLFRDSKFGNVVNGAVAAAVLYVADAAGNLNLSPLPDAIEPLAVAALATAVGLLVSWATARRTAVSRPAPDERPLY
jgi:hypothetical protein